MPWIAVACFSLSFLPNYSIALLSDEKTSLFQERKRLPSPKIVENHKIYCGAPNPTIFCATSNYGINYHFYVLAMGTVCSTEVPAVRFVPPERRVRNARAAPAEATVTSNTQTTANSDPMAFASPRTTVARPIILSPSSPLRPQAQRPLIAAERSSPSTQRSAASLLLPNPLVATTITAAEFATASPDPNRGTQTTTSSWHFASPPSTANDDSGRRAQFFPSSTLDRGAEPSLLSRSAAEAHTSFEASARGDGSSNVSEAFYVSSPSAAAAAAAAAAAGDSRRSSEAPQTVGRASAGGRSASGAPGCWSRSFLDDPFALISQKTSSSVGLGGSSIISGEATVPLDVPPSAAGVVPVEPTLSRSAEELPTPVGLEVAQAGRQETLTPEASMLAPQRVAEQLSDSAFEFAALPVASLTI